MVDEVAIKSLLSVVVVSDCDGLVPLFAAMRARPLVTRGVTVESPLTASVVDVLGIEVVVPSFPVWRVLPLDGAAVDSTCLLAIAVSDSRLEIYSARSCLCLGSCLRFLIASLDLPNCRVNASMIWVTGMFPNSASALAKALSSSIVHLTLLVFPSSTGLLSATFSARWLVLWCDFSIVFVGNVSPQYWQVWVAPLSDGGSFVELNVPFLLRDSLSIAPIPLPRDKGRLSYFSLNVRYTLPANV